MLQSKAQEQAIAKEIDEINLTITQMKEGLKVAGPRLNRLHDAGFHIETVIINGQLIEHGIKLTLRSYGNRRKILEILGETDPHAHIDLSNFEDQTMGNLIKLLTQFTGKTDLIKLLWEYKNKWRDEFTHTIFDGTKDIAQMEAEAQEYFKSSLFPELVIGLYKGFDEVKKETEALYAV